jgi:hypothetical protein
MNIMDDKTYLKFNLNQSKDLSSLAYNTVNQQHTPLGFSTYESTPASGNYWKTEVDDVLLEPAPRNQLYNPVKQTYYKSPKPYYKEILGNANWVRGNQFSNHYPIKKARDFVEIVATPSVKQKGKTVDYLGNNAKIVVRNQDPFYPYPSEKLLENKNYGSYPHEHKYLSGQPIFNYGAGLMEGGGSNPYLVEGFSDCNNNRGGRIGLGIGLVLLILILYARFYK